MFYFCDAKIKKHPNMKKFVNILLAICIVALIYIVYGSIMNPIRFANEKKIRDNAVIQTLMDIKAAETEYKYQHDSYCDNFDTLAAFIRTGKLPITKKIGEKIFSVSVTGADPEVLVSLAETFKNSGVDVETMSIADGKGVYQIRSHQRNYLALVKKILSLTKDLKVEIV